MTKPIIIPEPTGFAANLERDRQRAIVELADKSDMNSSPTKLANLGWMNAIVQYSKMVTLLGQILTELQESKSKSDPEIWIDANGIYYRIISENNAAYTYLANGEDHTPVEPSRPVVEGSIFGGIELISGTSPLSEPRYTRRKGQEELNIAAGATRITIAVLAGEVTCSHGDGTIPGGVPPLVFVSDSGLSAITLQGDADADYIVTTQYPVVDKVVEMPDPIEAQVDPVGVGDSLPLGTASAGRENPLPVIEESDVIAIPDLELTGDLLPAMTDLMTPAA